MLNSWQMNYLKPGHHKLEIVVYWTDSDDVIDHAPIFINGRLRPEVREYCRSGIEFHPEKHDFVLRSNELDEDYYQVYWNLVLQIDGANVSIKWSILKEEYLPFNSESYAP